jgi:DNA-binding MarR family transcriptional regulator
MKSNKTTEDKLLSIPQIDKVIHEPARLTIMAYLFVVESADFLFLQRQTGLTWGNLSSHISKLEAAGYVEVTKEFLDKKPHTALQLTNKGRTAFQEYRRNMKQIFSELPDRAH